MTEKCVICLIYLQIKRKVQRLLDYIMNDLMGKVILMGFEGKNLKYKKEICYDEDVHARWQSRLIC